MGALVGDLPALPAVAQEALARLEDPTTEPEELQAVLGRDPALSLKLLRLANSAFYKRRREISTLASAVLLLGFKTIQSVVLGSAVREVLSRSCSNASGLWTHCFAAAVASRALHRRGGARAEEAEAAYLAGLFHDASKGVIAAKFPGAYAAALTVRDELDLFGFHHGQLGCVLLSRWELPPVLAAAVGTHHDLEPEGLGRVVAAADWLSWEVAPGFGAPAPARPDSLLGTLGLGGAEITAFRQELADALAEEGSGHG